MSNQMRGNAIPTKSRGVRTDELEPRTIAQTPEDKLPVSIRSIRQEVLSTFFGSAKNHRPVIEVSDFPIRGLVRGAVYTFDYSLAHQATELNHGLHTYPAKFIPKIPRWAFSYAGLSRGASVLDPFCGCGTTLVEARIQGLMSFGLDVNPLARLISQVKSTPLLDGRQSELTKACEKLISQIDGAVPSSLGASSLEGQLPRNWRFWFDPKVVGQLSTIKGAIEQFHWPEQVEELRRYFLVCLSQSIKAVSYLDESQIKVRRSAAKVARGRADATVAFSERLRASIPGMAQFSRLALHYPEAPATIVGSDARTLPLKSESIDCIVTSPPYLNAIDYPMTHKYSMFILGLVTPDEYRKHCLEYIGPTERAVRRDLWSKARNFESIQPSRRSQVADEVNGIVDAVAKSHGSTAVDLNRAYIVWSYFTDMQAFLKEAKRVLKPRSLLIVVLGDNRIRGVYVPTHDIVRRLAISVGLDEVTRFYHRIRGRMLKPARNKTAGLIEEEMVTILRRPS